MKQTELRFRATERSDAVERSPQFDTFHAMLENQDPKAKEFVEAILHRLGKDTQCNNEADNIVCGNLRIQPGFRNFDIPISIYITDDSGIINDYKLTFSKTFNKDVPADPEIIAEQELSLPIIEDYYQTDVAEYEYSLNQKDKIDLVKLAISYAAFAERADRYKHIKPKIDEIYESIKEAGNRLYELTEEIDELVEEQDEMHRNALRDYEYGRMISLLNL